MVIVEIEPAATTGYFLSMQHSRAGIQTVFQLLLLEGVLQSLLHFGDRIGRGNHSISEELNVDVLHG